MRMLLKSKLLVRRSAGATLSSIFAFFSKSHLLVPSQTNHRFHVSEASAKTAIADRDSAPSKEKSIFHGLGSVLIRTTHPSHLFRQEEEVPGIRIQAFDACPLGRQDGVAAVLEDAGRRQMAWAL